MKVLVYVIAAVTLLATACAGWAIPPDECPVVSVTTCYVQPSGSPLVNCCDSVSYHPCFLGYTCCDEPPPDPCGCTTGHLYGRAVGSVAVKDEPGCENFGFVIRTGWMTWYEEYDEWVCAWFNYQWIDQYIVKNRGEPPTTYDHTVHLYAPPWAPGPCEYWKFETQISSYYEKCCTINTY